MRKTLLALTAISSFVAACSTQPGERSESTESQLSGSGVIRWNPPPTPWYDKDPVWSPTGYRATGTFVLMPSGACPDVTSTDGSLLNGVMGDVWRSSWGYGSNELFYQDFWNWVSSKNSFDLFWVQGQPFCVYQHAGSDPGRIATTKADTDALTSVGATVIGTMYTPTFPVVCYPYSYQPECGSVTCACDNDNMLKAFTTSGATGPLLP